MKSRSVLIADDNADAANSLGMVLRMSGHTVSLAYGGRQALALAESERPAAVVLDLAMPDLNGLEVARAIRAAPWGQGMLLVALSGRELDVLSLFDHQLLKPVDPARIEALLAG